MVVDRAQSAIRSRLPERTDQYAETPGTDQTLCRGGAHRTNDLVPFVICEADYVLAALPSLRLLLISLSLPFVFGSRRLGEAPVSCLCLAAQMPEKHRQTSHCSDDGDLLVFRVLPHDPVVDGLLARFGSDS